MLINENQIPRKPNTEELSSQVFTQVKNILNFALCFEYLNELSQMTESQIREEASAGRNRA